MSGFSNLFPPLNFGVPESIELTVTASCAGLALVGYLWARSTFDRDRWG
ncbi:MAG TPA: hypothetical protein VK631_29340 [Solirubrobacteraceae bacterium]|nr:hypothetical protein [Solirubrobacteraceae bacterium]